MADECKGCEKLEAAAAKLEAKLTTCESNLEKSLDDLATANAERDEAVKKANRLAKQLTDADADRSPEGSDGPGDDEGEKPGLVDRVLNWPFGA